MQWTREQEQAIYEKGSNILVAAAAGSGKTAVLVERIINKIINEKIDIDKMLVVTFTNLAAAQMRERILDAIYKRIEEKPEDMHLQRQITLLPKANICTIDSFCLDIVKNNFFELDISPNFRIADQIELEILKQETLEELFEEKYEKNEKDFIRLINTYTTYRGDENLKEIVLKIYNYIQSCPFPVEWLSEQVEKFNITEEIDFSKTQWGKILYETSKDNILDAILQSRDLRDRVAREIDMPKTLVVLSEDVRKLEKVYDAKNWDELYYNLQEFFFDRWAKDKNGSEDLNDELKKKRELIKKSIENIKKDLIIYDSETAIEDTKTLYDTMKLIEKVVIDYEKLLKTKKKEKNIVDFSDIEHFALSILIKDKKPSEIALKYQQKFEEIAIDEYQDSNMVQEYILTTISKNNNIFMVGDVKQSIYKFRQARPELFLEKYDNYQLKENKKEDDSLKIKLFKNFRSRREVLDITNQVFQSIMSKEFGEIEYDEGENLNLGAEDYPEGKNLIPELHIIELEEKEEENGSEKKEDNEPVEGVILEAKLVAKKIREMLNNGMMVCDKNKNFRKATYKDFAILLRSTKNSANIFEKELTALNIPVFCDATSEYLNSFEIQVIMSVLRIIDNPANDISQIIVLRSTIGNFNDNELIKIRGRDKDKAFYYSIQEYIEKENGDIELKNKLKEYLERIEDWRKQSKYLPLDELIWKIYMETGFYHYVSLMQNGEYRTANLKMLFEKAKQYEKTSFKGLFNFITFIDKLQISSGDMGGAKLIGENENVVRIMSIHKSKGLEFPIVFLSGTGKKFNLMDINQDDILIHNDLGLGAKFIDTELNVKFDTLSKKAVAIKTRQELVAEELRILYVALTRAKEKIIITAVEKNVDKSLQDKVELLECYEKYNKQKINKNILKKYMRYLDFLELVYLYNQNKKDKVFELKIHNQAELFDNEEKEEKGGEKIKEVLAKKEIFNDQEEEIIKKLNWEYEYLSATKVMTKSSVSKIKQQTNKAEEAFEEIKYLEPKFLKEELEISAARKGTLMHLILQRLDEKQEYTIDKIKTLVKDLEQKEIITSKEACAVNINKVYSYTKSELFKELGKAKKVYKEQPFYINIPASMIYEEDIDEKILVQGIIDLYYITEDNKVVLVDYKTDYIPDGNENILKEKYIKQLELYKLAIEGLIGKKLDNVYIYSTYLEKTVKIF